MGNVIVIGVLLCVVGLAVRFLHRQKKQGGCCGDCSCCSECCHYHDAQPKNKSKNKV